MDSNFLRGEGPENFSTILPVVVVVVIVACGAVVVDGAVVVFPVL